MKIVLACSHWMGFPSLELLLSQKKLCGVITPAQQNDSVQMLKQISIRNDVPLYSANGKRQLRGIVSWKPIELADALVVFSFPWRFPNAVLSLPRLGAFNIHPGKVPEYRGIEPIFRTLCNGESSTAISVMHMDTGLDTGNIVVSTPIPILEKDTYGMMLNKFATGGRAALDTLLQKLASQTPLSGAPQPGGNFPLHNRPTVNELAVDWKNSTPSRICNLVRAANPAFDGAFVTLRNVSFRILEATPLPQTSANAMPGTVISVNDKTGFAVACQKGAVRIDIIRAQEGIFSGNTFTELYGIHRGELFSNPCV